VRESVGAEEKNDRIPSRSLVTNLGGNCCDTHGPSIICFQTRINKITVYTASDLSHSSNATGTIADSLGLADVTLLPFP
jgi:hypothetical protein